MDKKSDALLRKMLKNWVNRQYPPDYVRERLLWDATYISRTKIDQAVILIRSQFTYDSPSPSNDWHQTLFTWINENSIQYRIKVCII